MQPSSFGQWLRETRKRLRLTQTRLAQLAQVHRISIAQMESGRISLPNTKTRRKLYDALGCVPTADITEGSRRRGQGTRCLFCKQFCVENSVCFRTGVKIICQTCIAAANQYVARELRTRRTEQRARIQRCPGTSG